MKTVALKTSFTEQAVEAIRTVVPEGNRGDISISDEMTAFPQVGDRVTILALDPLEFVVIDRRFRFDQNGISEIHIYLDLLPQS